MSLATLAHALTTGSTHAATARGALARLVDDPALGREALDVLGTGGMAAIDRLAASTRPGAVALRDAWVGAREASDALGATVGGLQGDDQVQALRAASHAEAAADLLDGFVYRGGAGWTVERVEARAGGLLDVAASALDNVRIELPRAPRAWETLRQ